MKIRKISLIRIAAISFLLTIFWNASSYAQPNVTGFSGSLTDGSTITINGNSFGANGPNIVVFDDFEGGTNNSIIKTGVGSATIGKWDKVGGGNNACMPKYDNVFSVSGNMAYKADYTIQADSGTDARCSAFVNNINTGDVFLSYWVYLPTTSAFPCYNGGICNWKMAWLYGIDTKSDDQVVPVGLPGGTSESFNDWAISCNGCYGNSANWFTLNMYKGKWYRIWAWIHGTDDNTSHKDLWVMSRDAGIPVTQKVKWDGQLFNTGGYFRNFMISAWARWCNNCSESAARFDDVYLATGTNAHARIEIGNSATYNTCTNLAIATATSWSDTSISATIRQGSFGNLNNAYLYVIDADGNVNSNGYLLSDGGGNTPPPSSGSGGGDTSASGGSGCGFVKDIKGKGQGAKGEGLVLMVMLIITLAGIAIVRKIAINKSSKGIEHIKKMLYFSLFFFVVFCIPAFANAADYYVATNGNDSNPGTEAQPWQHIAWATCGGSYLCPITTNNPNKLKAGDTLYVRSGTYSEYNIKFANSGTSGNLITIKGYPSETAIIDGGFTSGNGLSWGAVIFIDNNNYITLDGLTIKRGLRANVRIGYDYNPTNITIKNCDLSDFVASDNSGEITIVHGGNIVIENNLLHGYQPYTGDTSNSNNAAGVHIFYAGDLTIRNNTIYNTQRGIYYKGSWDNGSTTIIENNLIYNQNGWAGIMSAKRDTIIRNNIIRDVPFGHGILVFEESSSCNDLVSSDNKIIHNTIVDVYRGIDLDRSTSCQGAVNTVVKDNLIYNFTSSGLRGLSVWPYYSVDTSNTTFDHNLIYSSSFSLPINVIGSYYSISNAPLTGTGNIQQAPIFKDYTNKDFTLLPNSPGYKAASDGYDMGADTSLPPTPTPDGGGGTTPPPPSGGSGSDASASGGSGCGFVKEDGKGQKAKGEGVGLILLFLLLVLLRLGKSSRSIIVQR